MPSKNNNIIGDLRGKFDPHYKLASNVEGLEKGLAIQVAQLHKTVSKSFGMQRKTLMRVLALEKQVAELRQEKQSPEQDIGDWADEADEWESSAGSSGEKEVFGDEGARRGVALLDGEPRFKKRKIKGADIKKGSSVDKADKIAADTAGGKLADIVKGVTIRVGKLEELSALNARKITSLKNIAKENQKQDAGDTIGDKLPGSSGGIVKILGDIADNMDSIKNTVLDQQKLDEKSAERQRKDAEKASRAKQEKDLESKFSGIKQIGSKVLGPVKSLWEKLLNFITTILLGRVAMKLFDWFADPKNREKIDAIGRFLKDFWPALLGAYLLFGNALGRFITGMAAKLVIWTAKLVAKVIPALFKAIGSMGPWGWAALGTAAVVGGAAYMSSRRNERLREESNQQDDASTVTPTEFTESRQDDDPSNDETPSGAQLMNETVQQRGLGMMFNKGGLVQPPELIQKFAEGGFVQPPELIQKFAEGGFVQPPDPTVKPVQKFAGGGSVPGSGPNKDTVPAMLTPGEFVMSRPAVQKWGTDTLEGMNAAAGGGSNAPTINYNKGGLVDNSKFYSTAEGSSSYTSPNIIQHFNEGGEVRQMGRSAAKRRKQKKLTIKTNKTYLIEVLKESKEKTAKSEKSIAKSDPKVNVPKAPEKKSSATIAYEKEKESQAKSKLPGAAGQARQDLPQIDAGAMISQAKISTLGISV